MIYYVIIPHNGITSNSSTGAQVGCAIKNHSDLGNNAPVIVNELVCTIVITGIEALKKINFTKDDEIRLCLADGHTGYGQRPNHFDMDNISRVTDIYNYFTSRELKINKTVVYV